MLYQKSLPYLSQRAIDDKFTCMEQKEDEVHKLQLLLREKERDLEKLRCVLSNNEETITVLMSHSHTAKIMNTSNTVRLKLFSCAYLYRVWSCCCVVKV